MSSKKGSKAVSPTPEEILRKLRRLESNMVCPNCGTRAPQGVGFANVCVKFKIFICDYCKSSHAAISHRVKSITMSEWTVDEASALMDVNGGGNAAALYVWLQNAPQYGGKYPGGSRPKQGDRIEIFKQFVVDCYERGMFKSDTPYTPQVLPAGQNGQSHIAPSAAASKASVTPTSSSVKSLNQSIKVPPPKASAAPAVEIDFFAVDTNVDKQTNVTSSMLTGNPATDPFTNSFAEFDPFSNNSGIVAESFSEFQSNGNSQKSNATSFSNTNLVPSVKPAGSDLLDLFSVEPVAPIIPSKAADAFGAPDLLTATPSSQPTPTESSPSNKQSAAATVLEMFNSPQQQQGPMPQFQQSGMNVNPGIRMAAMNNNSVSYGMPNSVNIGFTSGPGSLPQPQPMPMTARPAMSMRGGNAISQIDFGMPGSMGYPRPPMQQPHGMQGVYQQQQQFNAMNFRASPGNSVYPGNIMMPPPQPMQYQQSGYATYKPQHPVDDRFDCLKDMMR